MFRDVQACVRGLVEERRQRVTLVIDEAHYLQSPVLRDLQMIANFDMDSRDMLAIVLVGHTVLAQYLSRQPHEALRQRLVAGLPGVQRVLVGQVQHLAVGEGVLKTYPGLSIPGQDQIALRGKRGQAGQRQPGQDDPCERDL